jgi:hypothetical protein
MSSPSKAVYNPKAVVLHATLLPQPLGHWGKFLAAASRRSLGRVSVPVCLVVLSDQVPVNGLVGRYPTNYLMGRRLVPERLAPFFLSDRMRDCLGFLRGIPHSGVDTHVFLSRAPRGGASTPHSTCMH